MRALACLIALAGCGEPTYYPVEPPAAYGPVPEWWVCGAYGADSTPVPFEVRNHSDVDVVLWQIPYDCDGAIVAEIPAGETLAWTGYDGLAWGLRDQVVGYIFDNWLTEGGAPTLVEIP